MHATHARTQHTCWPPPGRGPRSHWQGFCGTLQKEGEQHIVCWACKHTLRGRVAPPPLRLECECLSNEHRGVSNFRTLWWLWWLKKFQREVGGITREGNGCHYSIEVSTVVVIIIFVVVVALSTPRPLRVRQKALRCLLRDQHSRKYQSTVI